MTISIDSQFKTITDIQFGEDRREVMAHSNHADREPVRNLLVAQALADQADYFAFTFGQLGNARGLIGCSWFGLMPPQINHLALRLAQTGLSDSDKFHRLSGTHAPEIIQHARHQRAIEPDFAGKDFPN